MAPATQTETSFESDWGSDWDGTQSGKIENGVSVRGGRRGSAFVEISATDTDPENLALLPAALAPRKPRQKAQTAIAAVVQEVRQHDVALICDLSGEKVRISLPKSIVGEELAAFGMAVSLRLETRSGFRVPVVEKRTVVATSTPEHKEVDDWIDSICVSSRR